MSIRSARISASRRCAAGRSRLPPEIVIAVSRQQPTLVLLAANVGLAGFALRPERIEFLLEPFLGGFAGVDRAAPAAGVSPRHCCSPPGWGTAIETTIGWQAGSASTRRKAVPTTVCR